jgi:predicted ATPase
MPSRILCNGVQREGAKLSPALASELFCYVPLHKIRYGVQGLPLIGRDDDVQKILDELRQKERLVVLSGTVGVGKSELAYQVAEEAKRTELFPFVKIIYLENKTSLEDALKDIHKELQQLALNILLVLDNCEHLKGLTGELYKLRREHTKLTILATSSIEMTGSDYTIEPLETNDAVKLFLAAAKKTTKMAAKNFTPTEENAPKVAELCIGLDGLPLALLLAAGLLIHETFDQVHTWSKENGLLGKSNRFSESERHRNRTLSMLFMRIYELLEEDEQRLFRRLSIFAGACSKVAVAAVCTIDKDLPEEEEQLSNLLSRLADHYLISYPDGQAYIAHNTLRRFGKRQLKKDEKEKIKEQYIDFYIKLATKHVVLMMAVNHEAKMEYKRYFLYMHGTEIDEKYLEEAIQTAPIYAEDILEEFRGLIYYELVNLGEVRNILYSIRHEYIETEMTRLVGMDHDEAGRRLEAAGRRLEAVVNDKRSDLTLEEHKNLERALEEYIDYLRLQKQIENDVDSPYIVEYSTLDFVILLETGVYSRESYDEKLTIERDIREMLLGAITVEMIKKYLGEQRGEQIIKEYFDKQKGE